MPIETPSNQPAEWISLPVIATIARLLCRELTLQNEYLRLSASASASSTTVIDKVNAHPIISYFADTDVDHWKI